MGIPICLNITINGASFTGASFYVEASMDVKLLQDIAEAVKAISTPKTSAYDTPAKVTRVEDGVAWVHIDGGVDETPVKLTIAAQPGDTVQVRVGGGRAWLTGNGTAPPTDDRVANAAQKTAQEAQETANTAVQDAEIAHLAAESALPSVPGNTFHRHPESRI